MSLVSLEIFIVVMVGLQQASSQGTGYPNQNNNQQTIQGRKYQNRNSNQRTIQGRRNHCQMKHTKHQCSPGPGDIIYNSGTVWDPSQEEYGGVDENWNCEPCCQLQGKTIPQCDRNSNQQAIHGRRLRNRKNNQQQNNRNHCPMRKTKHQCIPGSGRIIYNSGSVWDPFHEQDGGEDENWNCTPCCQFQGKTIPKCDPNLAENPIQNNNQQVNQGRKYENQNNNQRAIQRRKSQNRNNNQHQNSRNHCLMRNTKHQCTPGPGRIIYNSGTVWDPSQEQEVGIDENWNCIPCCQFQGRTIQKCDPNMEQIIQRSENPNRSNNQQASQRRSNVNGNNNKRKSQNQNSNQRGNQGRRSQSRNNRNHCPMRKTKHQCMPGPGRRIYNSGNFWDPSQEVDGGVDENWNCKPCCEFERKTIPLCDLNKGQVMRKKRSIEEKVESLPACQENMENIN